MANDGQDGNGLYNTRKKISWLSSGTKCNSQELLQKYAFILYSLNERTNDPLDAIATTIPLRMSTLRLMSFNLGQTREICENKKNTLKERL